jgi:hypothetical protein
MGVATDFAPVFYSDLSTSPLARSVGITVKLPGVSLVGAGVPAPAGVVVPTDTSANSEANVIAGCTVSVSSMIGQTQAPGNLELSVIRKLLGTN